MAARGVWADPASLVEDEVRELVRRHGVDPTRDPDQVRRLVDEVITDYDERTLTSDLPRVADHRATARMVFDTVAGLGPLQPYLDDQTVEEIWINEPGRVFVARHGRSELTTTILSVGKYRTSWSGCSHRPAVASTFPHPSSTRCCPTVHACTS